MLHNSASDHGVGALSVLNDYYGRTDIPLGAYRGRVGMPTNNYQSPWNFHRKPPMSPWQVGPYVPDLVAHFPSRIQNASQVYDATHLLRLVLSSASPSSVTLVSIGYATNLFNLLESSSDVISPLSGRDLVSRGVKQLVIMGGRHKFNHGDAVEWNIAGATGRNSVCAG
jgi:purine nucleosidase